jgi:RNA polymerase sigma-70 factor (ECF subfamily)
MDQVATETGVPVGTVKSRLSRGRAALREHLGREYRSEDVIRFGEGTK